MQDKDLYHGFAPEKQAEYEDWLVENYGGSMRESIASSKAHWAGQGPAAMQAAFEEGQAAEAELAERFTAGVEPDSAELDPLFDRHRAWISRMWDRECAREGYAGMADMYLAHPDFRTHFDKRGEGFTYWLTSAMKAYAARG
jgi:hypothetical protein